MPRGTERGRRQRGRRHLLRACASSVLLLGLAGPAYASTAPNVTMRPRLVPAFQRGVTNYVTRCEPRERVRVTVSGATRTPVEVDGHRARRLRFTTSVRLIAGQRFTFEVGAGRRGRSYSVRCLPVDFPRYSVKVGHRPQAAYYLLTPTVGNASLGPPYVALFDRHGVPIWWYQELNWVPSNASLLANGNVAWAIDTGSLSGYPATDHVEVHRLDGRLVRSFGSAATSAIDSYETSQLPNGHFLMTGYALHRHVDLTSIGEGFNPVLDATLQEIRRDGSPAFTWDSSGRLAPSESQRWWFAWVGFPGAPKLAWDWQHVDSATPDGDGYLVSMCHTDALYLVRRSDGAIEWKLGGTPTSDSLTVIGAPAGSLFGCQSDARVLPDGTISVLDNGTFLGRPPRLLVFSVDALSRIATLVQTIAGPAESSSICCGSARLLPQGDWVIDWGSTGVVEERSPSGGLVLRIGFASPLFSYHAFPVLPGQLSTRTLVGDMDKMYPRRPRRR